MEPLTVLENEAIAEKIKGFLVDEFEVEPEKVTPEANMREVLGLDSLDYIDLGVVIESNFGFKVRHEDFATIDTFQSLYSYIRQRLREKNAS